ncbi:transposase family protein [Testudinibacter sp. TR-2022]|uniref:DDE-type integrase/transposase/recombinase n=1 Tax=Testudinibacter sp. TR-2022 TaxID=2585029 RepID=UPI00111963D4|nr:DDE-type integrase/transposase/recombinase [Testudinibacter sp. TR-2022]TNH04499.1 transposase family protein [Pasteurellaceae bacterium Phil31]TNH11979.1 transposase family protein [Testudinibacter sp. TR-2022]TNH12716.1 transposase family protein [Testudinibacter sp. TR-2022]TNH13691.1 transposase family protein [Testudinibacter sp. TR-2022]TNH17227.1 transposase family protein [Testudinibacter sp. TR-2022]
MAILNEKIMAIKTALDNAKHGEKGKVIAQAIADTGLSHATIMRQINKTCYTTTRKRRADSGDISLPLFEAEIISAFLMTTPRANGKQLSSMQQALKILRANGKIKAEFIDKTTGEVRLLSTSTVTRALYHYKLHPKQLNRPAPVVNLRSLHPNHCWQIDASLCVLYYLNESKAGNGLNIMDEKAFNKNKPGNVKKVEKQRVWRYVVTDHTSATIYVQYVYGGETTENLCNAFIQAMQQRHEKDPFHGVPKMIMLDPGSANISAAFKSLCERLGIILIINERGNPRAKGQVEKSNDLVERYFEGGLRFVHITGLKMLNNYAHEWMRDFNATAIHSRTKRTRYQVWLGIKSDQLTIAPSVEICRELALSKPKACLINSDLTFRFKGRVYSVKTIPEFITGEKVNVCRNPWRDDYAQVERLDDEGKTYWTALEPIVLDDNGFNQEGAIIGVEHKAHAQSVLQKNRQTVELLAMEANSNAELEAKRKAKALPFGGTIDPYKHINDDKLPHFIPKRGQEHELTTNAKLVELQPLTVIEAAKQGKVRYGERWGADNFNWLNKHYPDGIQQEEWEQLLTRNEPPGTSHLYVVNG